MSNKPYKYPLTTQLFDRNDVMNLPTEVECLRVGDFSDDISDLTISPEDLTSMVKNFQDKVRRVDLAVDEGHNSMGPAFGWIKNIYTVNGDTSLWASVEWNIPGKELISNKQYRYLSSEFVFEYTDIETGATVGPTLYGIALTNRPFVKDMQPLTLSDRRRNMPAPINADMTKILSEVESMKTQMTDLTTKLSAQETLSKKLSDELETQVKKNLELIDKNATIEKNKKFDEKLGKGLVCEAQRAAFLSDDMEGFLANQVAVNLNGKSDTTVVDGTSTTPDSQEEVIALAKKKIESEKCSLPEAISLVLKENPKLAKKYNEMFN